MNAIRIPHHSNIATQNYSSNLFKVQAFKDISQQTDAARKVSEGLIDEEMYQVGGSLR
jgi:hypothetical protein